MQCSLIFYIIWISHRWKLLIHIFQTKKITFFSFRTLNTLLTQRLFTWIEIFTLFHFTYGSFRLDMLALGVNKWTRKCDSSSSKSRDQKFSRLTPSRANDWMILRVEYENDISFQSVECLKWSSFSCCSSSPSSSSSSTSRNSQHRNHRNIHSPSFSHFSHVVVCYVAFVDFSSPNFSTSLPFSCVVFKEKELRDFKDRSSTKNFRSFPSSPLRRRFF